MTELEHNDAPMGQSGRICERVLPLDSKRRWRLARWLDKRFPSLCWSDLVSWVIYGPVGRDDGDLRDCRVAPLCFAGPVECDSCYCGKRKKADEPENAAAGERFYIDHCARQEASRG